MKIRPVGGAADPPICRVDQGAQRRIHHHSVLVDPLRLIHPTFLRRTRRKPVMSPNFQLFLHRVVSTRKERVTLQYPYCSGHGPFQYALLQKCLPEILRACRAVTAHGGQKGRHYSLINGDRPRRYFLRGFVHWTSLTLAVFIPALYLWTKDGQWLPLFYCGTDSHVGTRRY